MKRFLLILIIAFVGNATWAQPELNNQLIWYSGFIYPQTIGGINSMNDGEHFTILDMDPQTQQTSIKKFDYKSYNEIGTLLNSGQLPEGLSIEDYQFSADEKQILIATEVESIYRHSNKANYYVYNIDSKEVKPLTDFSKGKQRLAEFSPEGSRVAFVRENNIFIVDLETKKETVVTSDGVINQIINGGTDWVYEEEFAFDKGFYWSPDGNQIAYYRFDESGVKEFQMEMYGSLYPEHYEFKYPKAGEDNSKIQIKVYDIVNNKTRPFDIGAEEDIYIPRIQWTNDAKTLCVQKMNRLQNKLELLVGTFDPQGNPAAGVETKVIYSEEAKTYIDIHDNTQFLSDNKSFIWTSEKDGYNHMYKVDMTSGEASSITSGKWEVTEVYGLSEDEKTLYFQAAKEHATQREVYSVGVNGKGLKKLTSKAGTNKAEFSASFKYFINHHTDANSPHHVTLNKNTGAEIKVLEDNQALKDRLAPLNLSKKEFFTVKNAEGLDLNAWMIKPSNFDASKKYPLLMFVYGGPGINTVNDSWEWGNYFWWQLLAKQGYIVVSVDARGTGYRGRDFKHSTYQQLGKYETEDQIAAAKSLGSESYIDENRIGIFGWSYGGYMSSLCITKGADVFKTAIAVAPVTNWRYYDNVYTERFMRTPQENGANYDVNSPINHVDKLKGNYLLIHGSADDNVHFRNAMEMVDALQKANKQFDFMVYPNKNHGIYGGMTRWNLYDKMTDYILENL